MTGSLVTLGSTHLPSHPPSGGGTLPPHAAQSTAPSTIASTVTVPPYPPYGGQYTTSSASQFQVQPPGSYGSVSLAHSLHSITIPQQNIVTFRQMSTNSPQAVDSLPTPIVSTRPGRPRSTSTGLLPLNTQVSSDILTCWVEFCNTADASTEDYLQTQPWCGNLFSQRVGRGRPQLKVRCDCYFHCADDAHVARPCNYSTLCSMMPLLKGGACPGG